MADPVGESIRSDEPDLAEGSLELDSGDLFSTGCEVDVHDFIIGVYCVVRQFCRIDLSGVADVTEVSGVVV